MVYADPALARVRILDAAAHQFKEGDVQHWWHPQSGAGVRTRFSDDLLWLPFVTAHYVRTTGDRAILDEVCPFLEGRLLEEDEHEIYFPPDRAADAGTLLEHCRRAIKKGLTAGRHGLPLMGTGDWNDGMSLVGAGGKGESVWLAWFLIDVLHGYAALLDGHGAPSDAAEAARSRRERGAPRRRHRGGGLGRGLVPPGLLRRRHPAGLPPQRRVQDRLRSPSPGGSSPGPPAPTAPPRPCTPPTPTWSRRRTG